MCINCNSALTAVHSRASITCTAILGVAIYCYLTLPHVQRIILFRGVMKYLNYDVMILLVVLGKELPLSLPGNPDHTVKHTYTGNMFQNLLFNIEKLQVLALADHLITIRMTISSSLMIINYVHTIHNSVYY